MRLRKEVAWFAQEMERQLRENDHKGGWRQMTNGALLRRLGQEVGELRRAIKRENPTEIREEAADVANFAMMLADVVRWDTEPHA